MEDPGSSSVLKHSCVRAKAPSYTVCFDFANSSPSRPFLWSGGSPQCFTDSLSRCQPVGPPPCRAVLRTVQPVHVRVCVLPPSMLRLFKSMFSLTGTGPTRTSPKRRVHWPLGVCFATTRCKQIIINGVKEMTREKEGINVGMKEENLKKRSRKEKRRHKTVLL